MVRVKWHEKENTCSKRKKTFLDLFVLNNLTTICFLEHVLFQNRFIPIFCIEQVIYTFGFYYKFNVLARFYIQSLLTFVDLKAS